MIIYGRSDATLNPGGVRIGTAEIYRQVEQLPEVLESIVVGQDWQGDVRVVLFVRLQAGTSLDDALGKKIAQQIRRNTTPRHVPAKIVVACFGSMASEPMRPTGIGSRLQCAPASVDLKTPAEPVAT